ncbi:probable 3',5'-cyclic phosphodiesterase pde-5 isoform X2 [Epargyreus clarus]|uniref:probable 3',5'-cyclic phosphodiesterase pde-5 isoform X2 n=1 Tax=Epargyreus clarus TaxID=520877 RepID=UPI003C2B8268
MSEQRRRKDQPDPEDKGVAAFSEQNPSTSQARGEDTVRFSNVKCTRSLLTPDFRSLRYLPPISADTELNVIEYLDQHKEFLESYVVANVPLSEVERWVAKKMGGRWGRESAFKRVDTRYKEKDLPTQKQVFMELVKKLQVDTDEHSVLWELARYISASVEVDAYKVYKLFPDHPNFVQYFDTKRVSLEPIYLIRADADKVRHVIEVAKTGSSWYLQRIDNPDNFPETPVALLKSFGVKHVKECNHVLYQPILSANGKTVYVIEMWRVDREFSKKDQDISSNFLVCGSLILHYCNLYLDKKRERNMSDFLLDVVKAIFEEMVSLDQLIKRILEFAQRLVNADRASLFLVDYRNFELVSTVFDLKFDPSQGNDMEKKEIRMPINRGIAGHVALSGETMNIPDAYSDYRFNREVDEATGYKTVSILCMPVKVQGKVIGVVQMVNKRNDNNFDHEDEVSFEIFSTFFGLALHHARLYDKIIRKEQKYRVALEVLSYHNTCKEHEVKAILTDEHRLTLNVNDFYLDPYELDDMDKCKAAIKMFDDLFDMSQFDIMTLTRFILTVKKNYRSVPYHNFDHGWSVAHAMYVMLKNDTQNRFDYKMRLSLFVACLCHDLDHRGYTNKYMSETASPLAAMYTTSTLEHHHFNITVTILQQDGHNIFSNFSSDEYKDILRSIRQCILATDLAVFFPNLEKLKQIHQGKSKHPKFNWAVPGHRDLAMAISMTAADLSASAKPWEVQIKTVKVIFEEFYDQGDKERAAGKIPIPMMDRNKPEEQPSSQVGFLSQICIPCYSMLFKILPNTKPMYIMALRNLNNWKSKALRIRKKVKKQSSSDTFANISDSELDDDEISDQFLLEREVSPVAYAKRIGSNGEGTSNDVLEEVEQVKEISSEIQAAWQSLKSNSVTWEEEEVATSITKESTDRKEDSLWVEEEGAVARPNKAVKIVLISDDESDQFKNRHFSI